MTDEFVDPLVERWLEARERGIDLPIDELCQNCPGRAAEVEAFIRNYLEVEDVMNQANEPSREAEGSPWHLNGEPVPGYRLTANCQLDRGAQGEVWPAVAIEGGRAVALKRVSLNSRMGKREQRALTLLQKVAAHPHLAIYHHYWTLKKELVVVMDLASGSLKARLKEAGGQGLPVNEVLEYLRGAALGLDYLHQPIHWDSDRLVSILHRDVKPGNLLLFGGAVKVADFGLARALEGSAGEQSGVGTNGYRAPECCEGKPLPRSDQYSLAATYAHLRTGVLKLPPAVDRLGPQEAKVTARALAADPAARWESCLAFVKALGDAASPSTMADPNVSPTVASILRLFEGLNPRDQIARVMLLLGMPDADVPGRGTPAEREVKVVEWARREPGGMRRLESILWNLQRERKRLGTPFPGDDARLL